MSCNCQDKSQITAETIASTTREIIGKVGGARDKIVPLLQAIQGEFNYLPYDAINELIKYTDIDRKQLISVSTFYAQFRHVPSGEHIIKVCTGTACHVKGANNVYDAIMRYLGIEQGSITSNDMLFSIEKIACLGCCTLAPVVQIDEKTYGHVAPGRVGEMIEDFIATLNDKPVTTEQSDNVSYMGEVRLGMGSCCKASGSEDIFNELQRSMKELSVSVAIKSVGCVGVCNKVPLIDVVTSEGEIIRYPKVKAEEIKEILHNHFKPDSTLKKIKNIIWDKIDNFHTDSTWNNVVWQDEGDRTGLINSFLSKQKHISTEGYGILAPLDIDEFMSFGGFSGLKKAIKSNPSEIVKSILESGIRGRGGAGFPTGRKWEIMSVQKADLKYIICNGDEGDPGAFMDRMILESYPYKVIEGMLIGAYAVGATKGIFYIRAEYPLAVTRIRSAIDICTERGLLGNNILGTDFSFTIDIFEGAGAFVCGEETALIASIEGERGFPRQRPPFPAQKGLYGAPTIVNNVETLSQIPYILRHGAEQYKSIGTPSSSGTKVFALAGKVKNGGLIEVPMGITLNEIIFDIGGGVDNKGTLKAVQVGGPSGGCIPAELCDISVDFDAFSSLGAMMGSGGLVVLDQNDCMVDVARYFLSFTCDQSCGKCTFCRVGIRRMLDILDKICSGKGTMEDINLLEKLAHNVKRSSLCGLGKTAPNPVLTTLKYFRHEYEAHVNGQCPTGTCKEMTLLEINDNCIGCTKCSTSCPTDAIAYAPYEKHIIDHDKCVMCFLCIDECHYDAIIKTPAKS